MSNEPRPNLSDDEAYLTRMRDAIPRKEPLEEIHFEYLSDVLTTLGIDTDVYGGVTDTSFTSETKGLIERAFQWRCSGRLLHPLT